MRDAHIFGLRAVDLVAEDPAAGGAMRIHALAAIFAFAASRDARDQDAVAGTETGDTGADAVHHPDAFVTENAAGLTRRHLPFENVQIGSANGRLGDLYDCIGRSGDGGHRSFLKRLLAGTLIDKRFHNRRGFGFLLWRFGDERCHDRPHIC
jgi:hypothetical protein